MLLLYHFLPRFCPLSAASSSFSIAIRTLKMLSTHISDTLTNDSLIVAGNTTLEAKSESARFRLLT
jgi:hypothetical protein